MGVEPFLVAASLEGVLAQRLVRTICPSCRAPYDPNEAILTQLGVSPHELGDMEFYTGQGCDVCGGSGYKGRIGTYELLEVSDEVARMVRQNKSMREINETAVREGMMTLKSYACELIKKELTTVAELKKICND